MQHIYDKDALQDVRVKAPDVKESFECGWEESQSMPNIWLPDDTLPGFKEACLDFYWVSVVILVQHDPYAHTFAHIPGCRSNRRAMKQNSIFSGPSPRAWVSPRTTSCPTTTRTTVNCDCCTTRGESIIFTPRFPGPHSIFS